MNFRNIAINEIKSLADEFPDYTLGQILYSILRKLPKEDSIKQSLFNISDEDMYTIIENLKIEENES